MKRFTKSHEWIDEEGTVGITDYAKKELGDIVYVQLPIVGQLITSGKEICVLESTKAAADVYSPASGKITVINDLFLQDPKWLYKMDLSNDQELSSLMTQAEYDQFIGNS